MRVKHCLVLQNIFEHFYKYFVEVEVENVNHSQYNETSFTKYIIVTQNKNIKNLIRSEKIYLCNELKTKIF